MAFETAFLPLMTASVTVKTQTAVSGYGAQTVDAGVVVPAHVTYKNMVLRTNEAVQLVAHAVMVVPPGGYVVPTGYPGAGTTVPTIGRDNQIVLPDGRVTRVVDVNTPFDEAGAPHHQSITAVKEGVSE